MNNIKAIRYHDISVGHRVYQHESKCSHLHGHNYRIHFSCKSDKLDNIGRVIDFSIIKKLLCMWLEDNWDHKFLIFNKDPWSDKLKDLDPDGVEIINFNPTAENMGKFLIENIGPNLFHGTGVVLTSIVIEETRKCSVKIGD